MFSTVVWIHGVVVKNLPNLNSYVYQKCLLPKGKKTVSLLLYMSMQYLLEW
jgi:hypothetical protein